MTFEYFYFILLFFSLAPSQLTAAICINRSFTKIEIYKNGGKHNDVIPSDTSDNDISIAMKRWFILTYLEGNDKTRSKNKEKNLSDDFYLRKLGN